MDRTWSDLVLGEVWTSAPFAVSADEIVAFACAFDPQAQHTDPEAAASGRFGTLIASGWHVAALAMRAFIGAKPFGDTPVVGMGVDELRWHHPVKPGDTLTVSREVAMLRRSESKPDRGIVRSKVTVANQDGNAVMTLFVTTQMPVSNPGLARA
jgi:acyl dehydratase